jgi:hypothetical protein
MSAAAVTAAVDRGAVAAAGETVYGALSRR